MRKQSILFLIKNERGNILIITTVLMMVFIILFAGLCEFGRILVLRERTQTAANAAALAQAGSGAQKIVTIDITLDRGAIVIGCYEDGEPIIDDLGSQTWSNVSGPETKLIDKNGWYYDYCAEQVVSLMEAGYRWYQIPSYWYTIDDRQVKYTGDSSYQTASSFFENNAPYGSTIESSNIDSIVRHDEKGDPLSTSVIIKATTKMKSLFPSIFGSGLTTKVCAQGTTSARDISSIMGEHFNFNNVFSDTGKWTKPPEDGCADN